MPCANVCRCRCIHDVRAYTLSSKVLAASETFEMRLRKEKDEESTRMENRFVSQFVPYNASFPFWRIGGDLSLARPYRKSWSEEKERRDILPRRCHDCASSNRRRSLRARWIVDETPRDEGSRQSFRLCKIIFDSNARDDYAEIIRPCEDDCAFIQNFSRAKKRHFWMRRSVCG